MKNKFLIKICRHMPLACVYIIFGLIFSISDLAYASYETTFVVTSYYSPLPGQERYIMGSYEADRKMNGNGTNGASGERVFPGMIAAPSGYSFGTKIFIPGFGVGKVTDRGGAIKNNRIDLWMGFGDEGLTRALNWGKKTVTGTVYDELESQTKEVEIYIDFAQDVNMYVEKILEAIKTGYNSYGNGVEAPSNKVFKEDIGAEDNAEIVKILQETLVKFGYLEKDKISQLYDENTRMAVINYQIAKDVIEDEYSFGAGYVGPITRKALEADLALLNDGKYSKPIDYLDVLKKHSDLYEDPEYISTENKVGSTNNDVILLQQQLTQLGYLRIGEPTGYFGEVTKHALSKFQLKVGIINSADDANAGVLNSETKTYLNNLTSLRINTKGLIALKREEESNVVLASNDTEIINNNDNGNFEEQNAKEETKSEDSLSEMGYGDNNASVQKLQEILKKLGYLNASFTSTYFGDVTKAAVLAFQIDRGIVKSESELGAGRVGPKTLKELESL